jgi:hypothetical protein
VSIGSAVGASSGIVTMSSGSGSASSGSAGELRLQVGSSVQNGGSVTVQSGSSAQGAAGDVILSAEGSQSTTAGSGVAGAVSECDWW